MDIETQLWEIRFLERPRANIAYDPSDNTCASHAFGIRTDRRIVPL